MGDPCRRSRFYQLPQPTGAETLLPEDGDLLREFHHPEALELPKPSPDLEPPQCYPRFSKSMRKYGSSSDLQSPAPSWKNRIHLSPSTGRTPKGEKEAVAELLLILVDCMEELNTRSRESLLRKFFSEIERDERLERFIIGRLTQSKVAAISELCEKLPASVRGQMINSGEGSADEVGSTSENGKFSDELVQLPQYYDQVSEAMESDGASSDRSIVETVDELSQELERFKIRTLDVRVAVQEEGKK